MPRFILPLVKDGFRRRPRHGNLSLRRTEHVLQQGPMCRQESTGTGKAMYQRRAVGTTATSFASLGCARQDTATVGDIGITYTAREDLAAAAAATSTILEDAVMKAALRMGIHVQPTARRVTRHGPIVATIRACRMVQMPNGTRRILSNGGVTKEAMTGATFGLFYACEGGPGTTTAVVGAAFAVFAAVSAFSLRPDCRHGTSRESEKRRKETCDEMERHTLTR